jgi:hypothetical protein
MAKDKQQQPQSQSQSPHPVSTEKGSILPTKDDERNKPLSFFVSKSMSTQDALELMRRDILTLIEAKLSLVREEKGLVPYRDGKILALHEISQSIKLINIVVGD